MSTPREKSRDEAIWKGYSHFWEEIRGILGSGSEPEEMYNVQCIVCLTAFVYHLDRVSNPEIASRFAHKRRMKKHST
jgi:hypothetical protein